MKQDNKSALVILRVAKMDRLRLDRRSLIELDQAIEKFYCSPDVLTPGFRHCSFALNIDLP